ncbi:MAG TPA: LLM class flavin-dependent oxidoreductase, partial [Steroidobacteraceae bacterium]|nr:LLM class flavin-dependent oxidoreductase [Steroidobacteraceae bacterium]
CFAQMKPNIALYVGGMGAKGKNFHNEMIAGYGYRELTDQIQDLYLAGRKAEATELVPDELCDELSLCGPEARIRERYRAWEDAGVTTMIVASRQPEALRLMAEITGAPRAVAAL